MLCGLLQLLVLLLIAVWSLPAAGQGGNLCREHETKMSECSATLEQCRTMAVDFRRDRDTFGNRVRELETRPTSCPPTQPPPPAPPPVDSAGWRDLVKQAVDARLAGLRAGGGCEQFEYGLVDPPALRIAGKLRDLGDVTRRLEEVKKALPSLRIDQAGLTRLNECLATLGNGYGLSGGETVERADIQAADKVRLPPGGECEQLGRVVELQSNLRELEDFRRGHVTGFWVREEGYDALCRRGPDGWNVVRQNAASQNGLLILKMDRTR